MIVFQIQPSVVIASVELLQVGKVRPWTHSPKHPAFLYV